MIRVPSTGAGSEAGVSMPIGLRLEDPVQLAVPPREGILALREKLSMIVDAGDSGHDMSKDVLRDTASTPCSASLVLSVSRKRWRSPRSMIPAASLTVAEALFGLSM
jgi:hypothetical protein